MKKLFLCAALALFTWNAEACTNLIVGKKASVDGSVMCTYNCDGFGFSASLSLSLPGKHPAGDQIPIRGWGGGGKLNYIKQAEYTYNVAGLMNENQVTIVETTFDGRLELENKDGLLDYFTLMGLALQRSTTAREAIQCMADLVAEYGYKSTGETLTVCDKNEAWIMEIIGKGPGRKGAVWVALRVPDDCITAHANLSRIRQFPLKDKENCMYAKDVISFAREMGFFKGKDEDFSFRDAYCPIDFENVRYADTRVWSFFRHHYNKDEMDKYIPYLNGEFDKCDHLPLWIKPDQKLSVRDLMNDMRDHYEGTVFDMSADMSAGPWASPYRNQPINFKDSKGADMFRERPIGCQQSGMTMVCQMRNFLPNEVGGVTYFNLDDATMVAYVPVYCCINRIPEPFRRENNNILEFSTESAFWMNNFVSNMVYPRWSAMIGDLREAQKELEDYYAEDQKEVEKRVQEMETTSERIEYLTAKTEAYTDKMMKRWDKLAKLLIVKHNDQIMRPSQNGEVVSGRYSSPAYAPAWVDAVHDQTGKRYELKKLIIRRER
ncbi:MAG: C69 family dipeptidase [Bacteroidaceae bacterium]|nr:C69 family dipeptidase [Bacteroidaceae bacterium]